MCLDLESTKGLALIYPDRDSSNMGKNEKKKKNLNKTKQPLQPPIGV